MAYTGSLIPAEFLQIRNDDGRLTRIALVWGGPPPSGCHTVRDQRQVRPRPRPEDLFPIGALREVREVHKNRARVELVGFDQYTEFG